ncbi:MAG: glycosyltransferase [Chitinophagaceae bacterium]|nr:glycosyltransferase [Chitinophagaceae bacterium]
MPKIINWLPRLIYKSANAMVVQTAETLRIYKNLKQKLPLETAIIYNPLNKDIYSPQGVMQRQNIVLAVGRLYNKYKNFDKLIDMFVACNNNNWKLHIAGTGPDLKSLQDKIVNLNFLHRVVLVGSIKDLKNLYIRMQKYLQ